MGYLTPRDLVGPVWPLVDRIPTYFSHLPVMRRVEVVIFFSEFFAREMAATSGPTSRPRILKRKDRSLTAIQSSFTQPIPITLFVVELTFIALAMEEKPGNK